MTRAVELIFRELGDELLIAANGRISREAFALGDRAENFYMIGSMGLASAIALGLALNRPQRRVIILDGDGNLLMNLGILAQIGALSPKNLVHITLDNEVYCSTGNQPTISSQICLDDLARSSGYRKVTRVTEPDALEAAMKEYLALDGPCFILVKMQADSMDKGLGRVDLSPVEIRDRFMGSINGAEEH